MFYIIGLGNPGEEYRETRHNAGRRAVDFFKDKYEANLHLGKAGKAKIIESDEFMNNSGKAVGKVIKSKKSAEKLIVVYDDLDLPIGTMKISFNKGSGGHNGLESVIKAVKTKEFIRIRIGVSPATPGGKLKKPEGEKKVIDFILSKFKPTEESVLNKVYKKVSEAMDVIIEEGKDVAMNRYN